MGHKAFLANVVWDALRLTELSEFAHAGFDECQLFSTSSASVMIPPCCTTVLTQIGQQIEERTAGLRLKADTGGRMTIVDQHPIPQDAMNEVEWCPIEDEKVHLPAQE